MHVVESVRSHCGWRRPPPPARAASSSAMTEQQLRAEVEQWRVSQSLMSQACAPPSNPRACKASIDLAPPRRRRIRDLQASERRAVQEAAHAREAQAANAARVEAHLAALGAADPVAALSRELMAEREANKQLRQLHDAQEEKIRLLERMVQVSAPRSAGGSSPTAVLSAAVVQAGDQASRLRSGLQKLGDSAVQEAVGSISTPPSWLPRWLATSERAAAERGDGLAGDAATGMEGSMEASSEAEAPWERWARVSGKAIKTVASAAIPAGGKAAATARRAEAPRSPARPASAATARDGMPGQGRARLAPDTSPARPAPAAAPARCSACSPGRDSAEEQGAMAVEGAAEQGQARPPQQRPTPTPPPRAESLGGVRDWEGAHSAAQRLNEQLRSTRGGASGAVDQTQVERFLDSFLSAVSAPAPPSSQSRPVAAALDTAAAPDPANFAAAAAAPALHGPNEPAGRAGGAVREADAPTDAPTDVAPLRATPAPAGYVTLGNHSASADTSLDDEPSPPVTTRFHKSAAHALHLSSARSVSGRFDSSSSSPSTPR